MDHNNNNIQSIEESIQNYINNAFAKSEDNIRTFTIKVDELTTKFSDLISEEDSRDDTDYFHDESLSAERYAVTRSSWGKSERERKCRLQTNGELHRSIGEAPLDTYPEKEEDVLRPAVARTSRGKSEGERKCRFQNNNGELHRSNGEAPLNNDFLQVPAWCHVFKSKSPSSTRTRVAAVAYLKNRCEYNEYSIKHHRTNHKRYLNSHRKQKRQRKYLKDIKLTNRCICISRSMTSEYIANNVVICDGGKLTSTVSDKLHTDRNIHVLKISHSDLWVTDTKNHSIGLRLIMPGQSCPVFIRLPRKISLSIMSNGKNVCAAMRCCAQTQPHSLSRGKAKHVFTDDNNKYYCVGSQPGRAERGVLSGLYKLKHGFIDQHWDCIHNTVKRAEHAFDMFMDTDIIRHIVHAKRRVKFRTMEASPSSKHATSARYYNGVGFGVNVFLRCHTDKDFTMSIVQVHMDDIMYHNEDRIVCYFTFPRLGIAVSLRPGDILMFNPQEPHCISSRCNEEDEIYCISYYLKMQVVGLNDNSNTVI